MQQHWNMLSDKARMEAFRAAINKMVAPGDVVLDAGTGTGALAVMAAKAGAAKVYAVEKSRVAGVAKRVAAENGFEGAVKIIRGDAREIELEEKADGIICEMLGYCGFGEGISEVMKSAKIRNLKPGAWTIPSNIKTFAAPISCESVYSDAMMNMLKDYYAAEAIRDECANTMWLRNIEEKMFAAPPQIAMAIDLRGDCETTCYQPEIGIETDCRIHGLGAWFESELCEGVSVSSSPASDPTHWQQAFLPFRTPIIAAKGDILKIIVATVAAENGDLFIWGAELSRNGAAIEKRSQSSALSYQFIP